MRCPAAAIVSGALALVSVLPLPAGNTARAETHNQSPVITVPLAQVLQLPAATLTLTGSFTDDGLPAPPGKVTTVWSCSSRDVKFSIKKQNTVQGSGAHTTKVTFTPRKGRPLRERYTLFFRVSDGEFVAKKRVTITVRPEIRLPETLRVPTSPHDQTYPTLEGSLMAWVNEAAGTPEVYLWDLNHRERAPQSLGKIYLGGYNGPSISGNRVMWTRLSSGQPRLFTCAYDPDTGDCPVMMVAPSDRTWPTLVQLSYNEPTMRVAYVGYTNGVPALYGCKYDADTNICPEVPLAALPPDTSPGVIALSSTRLLWDAWSNISETANPNIFSCRMVHALSCAPSQVTTGPESAWYPSADAEVAAWSSNGDLVTYDFWHRSTERVSFGVSAEFPSISGERVAFSVSPGGFLIAVWDTRVDDVVAVLDRGEAPLWPLKMSGSRIVWSEARNGKYEAWVHDLGTNGP